jgi:hypothetical protein
MTNVVDSIKKDEPLPIEEFLERLTIGKVSLAQLAHRLQKESGADFTLLPKIATVVWNGQKIKQEGRWFNNYLLYIVAIFQNEHEWRVYTLPSPLPDNAPNEMKAKAKEQKEPPPPTRYTLPKLARSVNYTAESMGWPTLFWEFVDEIRELAKNTAICTEPQRECPSCGFKADEFEFALLEEEEDEEEEGEPEPVPPNGAAGSEVSS